MARKSGLRVPLLMLSVALAAVAGVSAMLLLHAQRSAHAGTTPFQVSVDCDPGTGGIQASCNFPGATTAAVNVVLTDVSGGTLNIGTLNFDVLNSDVTIFNPPSVAVGNGAGAGMDSNPDFNQSLAGSWNCATGGPSNPTNDTGLDLNPATTESRLVCIGGAAPISNGVSINLATVNYNVIANGTATFSLENLNVTDDAFGEIASCNPDDITPAQCFDTQITVVAGVPTATRTATVTRTPTITPTVTPTPCGSGGCPPHQTIAFSQSDKTFNDADFDLAATADSGLPVGFSISGVCSISEKTVHILSAGSCTAIASQPGDGYWLPADPVAVTFAINKASQSITFDPLTDKRFDETSVNVAATASSGFAVAFSSLTPSTCSVAGSLVTFVHAGQCTVEADQDGDQNYASASQQASFNITKGNQAITFATLADKTVGAPDFTVSGSASSGLAILWGVSGLCTNPSGTTIHLTAAMPGGCTVTAFQLGDSNWNAAASVPRSFKILPDADQDRVADGVDNCPAVPNADQANADRNFVVLPHPRFSFDDVTRANSDDLGDVCNPDADNDVLLNADESQLGPAGKSHALCPSTTGPTDPLTADTDGDGVLDGAECALGTDPTSAASKPTPAQCAAKLGVVVTADSDGDGVKDYIEYCDYDTDPHSMDTDGDGCGDAREIASVNDDHGVDSRDLGMIAASFGLSINSRYVADFDRDKDGVISSGDLGWVASKFGPCP